MKRIVKCVPNVSEGRRPEVIGAIVAAMEAVAGVAVLEAQPDADHNRTVVTMVGAPEAVEEAAFAGIARAAELIDMEMHEGEHPRFGAADVVPLVPVRGVSMEDCVAMARRLGQRVGDELGIPVYLYEAAATRPERANLADVRRGEYEGLKAEIETNPNRAPDFGPARLGKAGAIAIGARPFLIAFNVMLDSNDVEIAGRIARAVRHSSGGLRFVKALGLSVGGRAQVSMNLTDFTRTPIQRVMELIRREAARWGVAVTGSELVGLTPQQALLDAAAWYLQLELDGDQILENRLGEESVATADDFLEAVADGTGAPGGGSAAALAGALAGALATMVGRLTVGRRRYEGVWAEMEALVEQANGLRRALAARVVEDAEAYQAVADAFRRPKGSDTELQARQIAIQRALIHAAEVPLATAREAAAVMELVRAAARLGNANALSDAGTAAHLARAALEGAALNVRVNAEQVTDGARAAGWLSELAALRERSERAFQETLDALEERWAGG